MNAPITMRQAEILAVLGWGGGFVTGHIAALVPSVSTRGLSRHVQSAWVRRELLQMEKAGLIKRLDNQKPVAWVRCQ